MKNIKTSVIAIFLFVIILNPLFADGNVSEFGSRFKEFDFGIGIGIPYGGLGANVEAGKDTAFTAGLGVVPLPDASNGTMQIGWSTGIKTYFKEIQPGVRLRAGILWGTVAISSKTTTNALTGTISKDLQLQRGFAPIVGLRGENWDFDVAFPFGYTIPDGASETGGNIKFSFGFRF